MRGGSDAYTPVQGDEPKPHAPPPHPLQDEDRLAKALNDAPTWEELNAQLARGPDELETFNRLDREMTW